MPSIYAVIFGFGYLSISVLLENEEKHTRIFYNEKLFVQREKMGILCIKKTSNPVNLPQNVLECSIKNSRIVN